jgi:hypothetical protein
MVVMMPARRSIVVALPVVERYPFAMSFHYLTGLG